MSSKPNVVMSASDLSAMNASARDLLAGVEQDIALMRAHGRDVDRLARRAAIASDHLAKVPERIAAMPDRAGEILSAVMDELEHDLATEDSRERITARVDAAAAAIKRAILALHAAGQTAAVAILLERLERIARRATNLAAKFGTDTTEAPHVAG